MKITNAALIGFLPTISNRAKIVTNKKKETAVNNKNLTHNSKDINNLQPFDTAFIAYQMMGLG